MVCHTLLILVFGNQFEQGYLYTLHGLVLNFATFRYDNLIVEHELLLAVFALYFAQIYILVTIHRTEPLSQRIESLCALILPLKRIH